MPTIGRLGMLHEITDAVARPDHTIAIAWEDGVSGIVDFAPFIARGELFAQLQDPQYFVQEMRILRGEIGLTWPDEVDFSVDGLRHDAFPDALTGEYDEAASPS
jgi:hypothetical protein